MTLRLEVYDDWADQVATRLGQRLRPGLRLCLPTGATPAPVYARLATGFAGVTVFLLDEFGGLAPGHPARCDTTIRTRLLDHLDQPPVLHALDPDAPDLAAECARYQTLVDGGGLDLTILGLGSNGHLGLNEPGSGADSTTRVVKLAESTRRRATAYGANPPPTWGLTLGLAPVLRSTEIWLLVTGAHKAPALRRLREEAAGPAFPATLLRRHPNAVVLADAAAA